MKPRVIIITGTPGTGKSALAKVLSRNLKMPRLNLHRYYKALATGYDRKKRCYEVDLQQFEELVRKQLSKNKLGLIVDTHIAQWLPQKLVHLCIVLQCSDLKQLQQRLKRRHYSAPKIRENLEAEIFQVCLMEASEQGHKIKVFDTAAETTAAIAAKIRKYL